MFDLTQFEKDRDKKNNIYNVSCEDFVSMLTEKEHGQGYFHLTKWSTLCKMMEHVTLPDDGTKHRMLHLGAADNMNDEYDKKCGKGVFFASFSFGPAENISMWTNYGIPNKEAVRVKFHTKEFWDWVKDSEKHSIRAYGVDSDGSLKPLSAKPELKLVDVAYWSKSKWWEERNDHNDGIFIHNMNKFRLKDCNNVERFMKENGQYMFKEFGWNYESETRLVLKFDENLADRFTRVAIPFDKPLDYLEKEFKIHVWRGPWFNPKEPLDTTAAGHRLDEASKSYYRGKLKMRSVCDNCPKKNDDVACQCKYKRQR